MRKLISTMLAILVLVLSCIPCSDAMAIPSSSEGAGVCLQSAPAEEGHSHEADSCTPFCTCSCCASTALPVYYGCPTGRPLPLIERIFAEFLPRSTPDVFLPIWQPPRMV